MKDTYYLNEVTQTENICMTSSKSLFEILLITVISHGLCFANLPLLSDTHKPQVGSAKIYIPNPSMMGLNKPATQIRQTGPLQNRIYGHPGISNPNIHNHYRYLYSTYNYRRMSYPYLAYYGRGARNPGYFNFNQRSSSKDTKDNDSRDSQLKFTGARIINTKSSLEDKSEGRFSAKQFLKLWVKAAGPLKAPPSIRNGEIAVYMNTPLNENIRLITKVETVEDKEGISKFLVHYESKKPPEESSSFYSIDGQKPKGFMSAAIFAFRDQPIELVSSGSEDSPTSDYENSVEILEEREGSWAVQPLENYKKHEGSNITRNYTLRGPDDLSLIRSYFKVDHKTYVNLKSTDWDRELVYLTGRIYESPTKAVRKFDRKITSIYEWREKRETTKIKHYVEITEPLNSRETFDLESVDETQPYDLKFGYHWVRVGKPRNFAGLRTFSIRTGKE